MKYLIILIIFLSCGINFDTARISFNLSNDDIRQEIIDTVIEIANENILMSAAVGIAGIKTLQYERFEFLYTTATEDELLELMEYPNGVVKGYTFWALAKMRSDSLESIIENHIDDTDTILSQSGCLMFSYPVIDFMIEVVTPGRVDIDCLKLSEDKLERLRKLRDSFN